MIFVVCSEGAAGGLDVNGVSIVCQLDWLWHPGYGIHRIVRTGRAGATGTSYTCATKDDAEAIENIERLTGRKIERIARAELSEAEEKPAKSKPEKPSKPKAPQTSSAPERKVKAQPPRRREAEDHEPDEGWNGPVPDFLMVKLGC